MHAAMHETYVGTHTNHTWIWVKLLHACRNAWNICLAYEWYVSCIKPIFHALHIWLHDGWCNNRLNADIIHKLNMFHTSWCCNAWNICWNTYKHICIWWKCMPQCMKHIFSLWMTCFMHDIYVSYMPHMVAWWLGK